MYFQYVPKLKVKHMLQQRKLNTVLEYGFYSIDSPSNSTIAAVTPFSTFEP